MTSRRLGYLTTLIVSAAVLSACHSSGGRSAPLSPALPPNTASVPQSTAPDSPQPSAPGTPAASAPAGDTSAYDGSYTGYVYSSGEQPNQGLQLTFTVSNGAVHDWQGYEVGECYTTEEDLYIQGPSPITSGTLSADYKFTDPSNPSQYTNTYVAGVFDGTKASGTVDYVAIGPCVEARQYWVAVRTGS